VCSHDQTGAINVYEKAAVNVASTSFGIYKMADPWSCDLLKQVVKD
jgi:hypothetical protein